MAYEKSNRVAIGKKAGLTIVIPPLSVRAIGEKSTFVWTLERGEVVECQLLKHGKKAGTIMLECPVGAGLVIQDRNQLLGSAASGSAKDASAPAFTPELLAQAMALLAQQGIGGNGKVKVAKKPPVVDTDDDSETEAA